MKENLIAPVLLGGAALCVVIAGGLMAAGGRSSAASNERSRVDEERRSDDYPSEGDVASRGRDRDRSTSTQETSRTPGHGGQSNRPRLTGLERARDVDLRSAATGDPNARECQREVLLTDLIQGMGMEAFTVTRMETPPMSWEREQAVGAVVHEALTGREGPYYRKVKRDSKTQNYLESLLNLLRPYLQNPAIEFKVFLINDDTPNAAATVGGYIYVHTGILAGPITENEAQLMFVLAHEVAHVDLRHTSLLADVLDHSGFGPDDARQHGDVVVLNRLLTSIYSKSLEDESDAYAYDRVVEIGYSPFQAEKWWWTLHNMHGRQQTTDPLERELENLFSSHASSDVRACNIRRMTNEKPPAERTYRGRENLRTRTPAMTRVY